MTGAERRNHPGNLGAMAARSPLSHSPSPSMHTRASSSSNKIQLSNRNSLAQRSNQHPHFDTPNFSTDPHSTNNFGATPNYELPSDGLFQDINNDLSSFASGTSYWLADNHRSQSVPPRIAIDTSHTRATNSRRAIPLIDTSGRPHSRIDNLMEDAEKRPTSPHITSATPTSARHSHPFSPQHQSSSRSSSFHEHDAQRVRQNKSSAVHRVASPSLLNSGIGRAAVSAAQSIMDAVAGRASPVTVRAKYPSHQDRDSLSDDEAGKGHGRKAGASVASRYTPSVYHPRHHQQLQQYTHLSDKSAPSSPPYEHADAPNGVDADVTWRQNFSESRRATPAAYRPRSGSPTRRRNSAHIVQQPTGDDSTDMRIPDSRQKSTHSCILIGSPIVIPQARRGAVRLRPRRRRKVSRPIKPQRTLRQNIYVLIATIVHLMRLLASPAEALRRFREYCIDTRIAMDDAFRDPQSGMRSYYPPWLQAYVPLLIWLGISLSSTALVITFHTQVFIGLDHMATYLQGLGVWGKVMLGSLIFLTTFPPLPLYSTLIMLCGFSFGLWQGFIISYVAALAGAIVVFTLSRSLLREWMVGLLNKSGGLKKVVRAIEKQPKLLFLVRLAPYPYNLMNTLLASSPTLTLRTYVTCTALALPKLLIHTGLGTSIKDFAAYNGAVEGQSKEEAEASKAAENVKKWASLVGIGLCVGIMIYLLSVARKAVDELDDESEDLDDGYEHVDVLFDQDGNEVLSCEFEEEDDDDDDDDDAEDDGVDGVLDGGAGVDMRERAGPSTLGLRNGYAPITCSPEERFRQSMRHPQAVSGPLVLPGMNYERASGSGSFDGRMSFSGSGSGGNHSIDLVDKIAEMEAHAESMTFESIAVHSEHEAGWSPVVDAALQESVDTVDTVMANGNRKCKGFFLDHQHELEPRNGENDYKERGEASHLALLPSRMHDHSNF
ncbi:uncharacterized protein MEPE_06813 [Melanopsichium pennsylvanicum]|uniref:Golgi apparatus membrane protein TVP38 n=2 Tax=Melanopsichium pennsylvanicum TaxID=63383 RepID=A0AAJ4XTB4_9BASI|nr:conserved hypothetical protein [Melanopsichium pennsylvanicum 4]SNX88102.1 uncharacterized protein MEPE_06813 [Melanopsichium pennsylvanicum]